MLTQSYPESTYKILFWQAAFPMLPFLRSVEYNTSKVNIEVTSKVTSTDATFLEKCIEHESILKRTYAALLEC